MSHTWQHKQEQAAQAADGSGEVKWKKVGDVAGPPGPPGPPGAPGANGDPSTLPELAAIADLDGVRDLTLLFENGTL